MPAPCPWARQTCSTGAVYKSSLSHALTPRCQPDLHASGATSLQLRQCAPARQTQSYACCNLIARAVFSSPFRPFAAPPPIQLSPAPSLHATLSRPCLIALTSPFPLLPCKHLIVLPCPNTLALEPRPVCTLPASIPFVYGRPIDTMVFCTYCGQSFTRDEHLERHILTRSSPACWSCRWISQC